MLMNLEAVISTRPPYPHNDTVCQEKAKCMLIGEVKKPSGEQWGSGKIPTIARTLPGTSSQRAHLRKATSSSIRHEGPVVRAGDWESEVLGSVPDYDTNSLCDLWQVTSSRGSVFPSLQGVGNTNLPPWDVEKTDMRAEVTFPWPPNKSMSEQRTSPRSPESHPVLYPINSP